MKKLTILIAVFTFHCSLFTVHCFSQAAFSTTIGGTGYDSGNSIIQTTDGGLAIAGKTESFGAVNGDVYVVKLDEYGNYACDGSSPASITGTGGVISTPASLNSTVGVISTPASLSGNGGTQTIQCSTVPIELLSFNAFAENNSTVRTEWSTASEINNDYFSIERSLDAINFVQIGTVRGAGNSNTILYYAFYDEHPYTGISYYRLKQTDYDGKYEYSQTVSVFLSNKAIDIISIYPNPAHDYIQYSIGSNEGGEVTVKIIDILGREVMCKEEMIKSGVTKGKLSTAGFASSTYLLRITTKRKENTQKQFVVK